MQKCSYFIEGKALFGSFPTQEEVDILEQKGVRIFVDLTENNERMTTPYTTKYRYIKYSIADHNQPTDWTSFAELIIYLSNTISNLRKDELLYIHCRGGHGRSGMVVACILCHKFSISPEESLELTSYYHSQRPEMREKWRKLGSPQVKKQRDFVKKFFRPFRYDRYDKEKYNGIFNNNSNHPVDYFPTAALAIESKKDPENKEYIEELKKGRIVPEIRNKNLPIKIYDTYSITSKKVKQNSEILEKLLGTGLRPLISDYDLDNIQGKILVEIRNEILYENMLQKLKG